MTSFQNQILVIIMLTLTSLSYLSTALPNNQVDSHGFSAPLFDQTLNITKDFQYWSSLTRATMARANYMESLTKFSLTEYTYQIPASSIASGYVVKLRLGGPYVDVTLVVDTGSSIIWTQCQPCKNCFNQSSALYDPEESSLSDHVPCTSRYCSTNMKCMDDLCTYYIGYGGGSYSKGYLAADMISFSADNYKTKYALVSIVVGCGQDNVVNNVNGRFTGILGLNGSPLSFISQAGSNIRVFSYCFPSLGDTQHQGMITFGDGAVLKGNPTPFTIGSKIANYFLKLDDISVGSERLNLIPDLFQSGGLLIDSGSTMSVFRIEAWRPLMLKLVEKVRLVRNMKTRNLCFYGTKADLLSRKVPTITFHFNGNLDVVVDPIHSFYEKLFKYSGSQICLSIISATPGQDLSIFGASLQQGMNVGYDLAGRKLYMDPAIGGCPVQSQTRNRSRTRTFAPILPGRRLRVPKPPSLPPPLKDGDDLSNIPHHIPETPLQSPPPFSPLPSQITNASLKLITPCSRRHLLSLACLSAHQDSGSGLPAEPEPTESSPSSKEARFDLKLPRRNLIVQFTCNACGERTKRIVNRLAYERGTVFVQCAGCLVNHKLVDNLGLVVEYDLRNDAQGSEVSS